MRDYDGTLLCDAFWAYVLDDYDETEPALVPCHQCEGRMEEITETTTTQEKRPTRPGLARVRSWFRRKKDVGRR
jgi:hypothetical protein